MPHITIIRNMPNNDHTHTHAHTLTHRERERERERRGRHRKQASQQTTHYNQQKQRSGQLSLTHGALSLLEFDNTSRWASFCRCLNNLVDIITWVLTWVPTDQCYKMFVQSTILPHFNRDWYDSRGAQRLIYLFINGYELMVLWVPFVQFRSV